MDISCNEAKMYLFFFLICVMDSFKGFSRCRGYWSFFVVYLCVYICSAVLSTSMLGVSHAVQDEKRSLEVYTE